MSLSFVQYAGNGSTATFAVPFDYLSKTHVGVKVDGVPVAFTWDNANTVRTFTAPAEGSVVEVRRTTPRDVRLVDFVDGSVLSEADLDVSSLQNLYLAQEAVDIAGGTLELLADGSYSAGYRRIARVAAPVNDDDAVNRGYFNSYTVPAVTYYVGQAQGYAVTAQGYAESAALSASAAATFDPVNFYTKAAADERFYDKTTSGLLFAFQDNIDANSRILSRGTTGSTLYSNQAIEVRPPTTYAEGWAGIGFHRPGLTAASFAHGGNGFSMFTSEGAAHHTFPQNGDIWTLTYGWLHDRFVIASDRGLKSDVKSLDLETSYSVVEWLLPVSYRFTRGTPEADSLRLPDGTRSGFVAQDLALLSESLVEKRQISDQAGAPIGSYLALTKDAPIQIIAHLVNVIQDLHERVTALETPHRDP